MLNNELKKRKYRIMPASTHTVALMALAERQYLKTQNFAKGDKACPHVSDRRSNEGTRVRGSSGGPDSEMSKKRDSSS